MAALPAVNNWFGARFDEASRAAQGDGKLSRNDSFLTIVMHPNDRLRGDLRAYVGGSREHPEPDDLLIQELEAVRARIEAGYARYGLRRLGVREQNGVVFSEIAEALHLIANGRFRPIGLVDGRLGRLIVPDRIVFGHRDFQIMGEGEPLFGAVLTFLHYPARTSPTMFAALRRAPFPMTITNAVVFHEKAKALGAIGLRVKQMQSGNDAARSQMLELARDEDDVMSGRSVYVTHHFSVVVRAPTLAELDHRVALAQSIFSDAGVTGTRETTALKAAFHGQIPGNRRWWPRPGQIKSINAVAFAPRHDVPRGHDRGRWGAPIVMLRTTADTEYAFHFHVHGAAQIPAEDLGNCLLIGPAGSGKTGLLGSVSLLSLRCPEARVVIVDKDYGLSVMVRAAGGSYLVLPSGSPVRTGAAARHGRHRRGHGLPRAFRAWADPLGRRGRSVRRGGPAAAARGLAANANAASNARHRRHRGHAGPARQGRRRRPAAPLVPGRTVGLGLRQRTGRFAHGRAHDRLRHHGAVAR